MEKKRPIGMIILIVVLLLYSVTRLPGAIRGLLAGPPTQPDSVFHLSSTMRYFRLVGEMIFQFLILVAGIGLFFLKSWARKLSIYTTALFALWLLVWGVYLSLLFPMFGKEVNPDSGLPDVYIAFGFFILGVMPQVCLLSIVVFYLTRPKIKELFKKENQTPQDLG